MLSIRNPEVERVTRDLAIATGKTMTETILDALLRQQSETSKLAERKKALFRSIAVACAAAPDLDTRSADELLGYDEAGGFGDGR